MIPFRCKHCAMTRGPQYRSLGQKQGLLHMTKEWRHMHVTLIMRNGLPLSENPLVLSHHCMGSVCRRYHVGRGWQQLLKLFQNWRGLASFCIMLRELTQCKQQTVMPAWSPKLLLESCPLNWRKWTLLVVQSQAPYVDEDDISMLNRHLLHLSPITSRRYTWIPWSLKGARAVSMHFMKEQGDNARPNGRTR